MPSLFRPQGTCGAGMRVPMAVVAEARDMEAKDREEEQGQEEQVNLWTDEPPPDPTAGRLLCQPWEAVFVRRGYVLGCRDL